MFTPDQYELLDFGEGRRLERFGSLRLDRPCAAAEGIAKADAQAWQRADARFRRDEGKEGQWLSSRELPKRWTISHGPVVLELKRTEFGHLGVFAEQAENWDWIDGQIRSVRRAHQLLASDGPPPLRILNLFAYTGGGTLKATAAGAEVVHVDSARNTVAWARRNAELSGLADAPVRWIAEDAVKFARRELKRGNRYDAVILDPPSYGHGPRGEVWRISKHLPRLLATCGQLTAGRRRFIVLTCHTPKFDSARLKRMVADELGDSDDGSVAAAELTIRAATGRRLPSGIAVRWQSTHGNRT